MRVFRNAADDESTQNGTDSYLTGSLEGDLSDPAPGANYVGYIYWTGSSGSRKVILRKVDEDYTAVKDKKFVVYKGSGASPYIVKNGTARTQLGRTSGTSTGDTSVTVDAMRLLDSGVFWIGNLPYGWYIVEEEAEAGASPKYFFLVVTGNGTYGTLGEDGKDKADGYNNRSDAETQAKKVYEDKK